MTPKNNIPPKVTSVLKKATELHGHLGPFLVIGVRMGLVGRARASARKQDSRRKEPFANHCLKEERGEILFCIVFSEKSGKHQKY